MTPLPEPAISHRNGPTFSVIIPCWNSADTLSETLDSVLSQCFSDWEMIIVNDASTDNSTAIIGSFAERDPRIKSINLIQSGPSRSRNFGALECARGKYLAFLDADDLWHPNKLSIIRNAFIRAPDLDGIYAKVAFFRNNPAFPETVSKIYPAELKPLDILRDNPVCTMSNLVLKTSCFKKFGGFNPDIRHNEDIELLVRMIASGVRIAGLEDVLVFYRTSLSGLSANLNSMRTGWRLALQSLQSTDMKLTKQQLAEAEAGNLRYLARRALRTDAPRFEALKLSLAGISKSPKSFFSPVWRGAMTLAGALLAPVMTKKLRNISFSR